MVDFSSPNPVRKDYAIPLGQNFNINTIFQDGDGNPKDMTGYSARVMVKKNNSDKDCDAVIDKQIALTSESDYMFQFTPEETQEIGEGISYWDMWIKKNDGATWHQAGVFGSIEIVLLTTGN